MTMTCAVPCHALHAPQHAAATLFGPLNHINDFLPPQLPKQTLHNWIRHIQICRFLCGVFFFFFFWKGAHFFNIKIARFTVWKLHFFSGYIQPIFIKQSTSHIRIWALFINIQRIYILHAVFANIRTECNFDDGNVGSVHTFIRFECLQILHAGFK